MMIFGRIVARLVLAGFAGLSLLGGCSSGVAPGTGETTTIAGKTFAFSLGDAGTFELVADGAPVQKATPVTLLVETPSDVPGSGSITLAADAVGVVMPSVTKTRPNGQSVTSSAAVAIRINNDTSVVPCNGGVEVGTFNLTLSGDSVSLEATSLALPPEALAFVASGRFTLCLEVTADTDVSLTMGEMSIEFGPIAGGGTDTADGQNGNGGGVGGGGGDAGGGDGGSPGAIKGTLAQVTFIGSNDTAPKWDPVSDTIAYTTDRDTASTKGTTRNIGWVRSDGTEEGQMVVGPDQPFGIGGPMHWVGSTRTLLISERVVVPEFMTFDVTKAPFTRTVNDGDDTAFQRKLAIPSNGNSDLVTVSRDGETVIWLFRSTEEAQSGTLRFGPFSSLVGQNADSVGSLLFSFSDWGQAGIGGVALTPDGAQFVISWPSGDGHDLLLYTTTSPPVLVRQLTTTGRLGMENRNPDISPDGLVVAFDRGIIGGAPDLSTVGIDGLGLTDLTVTSESESNSSWSPDGRQIAFQRFDKDDWNIHILTLP